jgi:lipoyl-dependent peroxiredoxin subunit D
MAEQDFLEKYQEAWDSPIARDLKLNLRRILREGSLAPEEAMMALLATAKSARNEPLADYARTRLVTLGVPPAQIDEAAESAAIMGMLNTYYRFRHFVQAGEAYGSAGLRMTSLAKPGMGKQRFEMLALAVSILNGCETCVRSHEQLLRESGVGPEKLHDLARLASVVRGLSWSPTH